MRARAWIFDHWTRVSEQFGFEMVEGPVLEAEDLFVRKAGEEIVGQLYNFEVHHHRAISAVSALSHIQLVFCL